MMKICIRPYAWCSLTARNTAPVGGKSDNNEKEIKCE